MNQLEVVSLVSSGRATWTWTPLVDGIEVMAWPVMLDGIFLSVSARTASACAAALNRNGWMVSLTTPKVEDLIYEHAAARPEPVVLDPRHTDVASSNAVLAHSGKLLRRFAGTPHDALVACGKNWVFCNAMLDHPGYAASYGMFAATAPHRNANGAYRLWQPLSLEHDIDYWDYSQLLRLARRRPGTVLPSYDEPLRVFELVRECALPITLTTAPERPEGRGKHERAQNRATTTSVD